MPSQFFGLQIGYSGLTAYQAALHTTGNNISNVETEGYSRQKTNQKAAAALRTYTSYGMAGAGTTVTSIDQVRNAYYDIKYRNAASSLGEYTIKASYMKQIENYLSDDGQTIEGFSTLTDRFYSAVEEIENNPGDVSTRTTFVQTALGFTEYFNSLSTEITKLQEDVNEQIKTTIDQINSLASQIATMNRQINIIELKGSTANELRDQRNNLVDKLSKFVDVEINEDPIYSDVNNTVESGAYRYSVTIAGNQTLVDGYEYRTMECRSRTTDEKVNQSDAEGLYDIHWTDTDMKYYPVGSAYSGELKGMLQVRDGNNNEYLNGVISGIGDATDSDGNAVKTVTISVTDEYLQDITKTNINPIGTLALKGVPYKYTDWSANYHYDGDKMIVDSYTFTLAKDSEQDNRTDILDTKVTVGTTKGTIGTQIDYQGIPYYMEQMNEWVRNFAKTFNDVEESGEDMHGEKLSGDDGSDLVAFFVANDLIDGDVQHNFAEQKLDKKDGVISGGSDSYYLMTAASFTVNKKILNDASLMSTTATDGIVNVGATDIIQKLEKIKTDKTMMTFRGCSSSEFLSCVLGDVALNANSANTFEKNFANIQSAVTNQRLSESGVDNDEEALDLVKYQNAYNLSAKMIQVMTEIYDRLILNTGV